MGECESLYSAQKNKVTITDCLWVKKQKKSTKVTVANTHACTFGLIQGWNCADILAVYPFDVRAV